MALASKVFPILCILISIFLYYWCNQEISLIKYCKHQTIPLIYNDEVCNDVLQGNIMISNNYFQNFMNLFSAKSLFRGKFNNASVVLKTIESSEHLRKMESDFIRIFSSTIKDSSSLPFVQMQVYSLINFPIGSSQLPKLRFCPFNSSLIRFLNKIPGSSDFEIHNYFQLWTILYSNPEPLILKILDPKVWPVPEYFGSCGQIIVVEDCGLTLTNYYDSDWNIRANLSYQILENAMKFTFEDPDFSIYLTDINPDNIAVTQEGVVKYIDLEHIILIDKKSADISLAVRNQDVVNWKILILIIF